MNNIDYDKTKYVAFELDLNEIITIRELLRFETIFQIGTDVKEFGDKEEVTADKTIWAVFNIFENYRTYDDVLKQIYLTISDYDSEKEKEEQEYQNLILISPKAASLFKWICSETPKLNLPEHIKVMADKDAANIINKIQTGLSEFDAYNSAMKFVEDGPKTNIFNVRGLA